MLGEAFYKAMSGNYQFFATDIDLNDQFLSYADVRDKELLNKQINEFKPDLVVNLAALTDLEYCEQHEREAYEVNALGCKNVVEICAEKNLPVVHISTAGIFDGTREFYVEDDIANPLNVYGKSKFEGEQYIRAYPRHFMFRAGWMMGGGPRKDKKFVSKLMKKITAGDTDLYVVDDKVGTPTYTHDLARNIFEVVSHDAYGVFHTICQGEASRYDVARFMLSQLGREDIVLHRVTSNHESLKDFYAIRPWSEKLVPAHLKELGLYTMRPWQTCLEEYLIQWK